MVLDTKAEKEYLVGMVSFYKQHLARLEKKADQHPNLAQDFAVIIKQNSEILEHYQTKLKEFYVNALSSKKA